MAVTLVNLTGFTSGISSAETGINVKSFKVAVEPEFNKVVPNKDGTARGRVVAPMKAMVSLAGEVSGNTGIMAATAIAATTLANSTTFFGAPTTGAYLQKAEVTAARDEGALLEMSAEFEMLAGIA